MMQDFADRIGQSKFRIWPMAGATLVAACWLLGTAASAQDAPPAAPPPAGEAAAQVTADPPVAKRGNVVMTASMVRDMVRFAEPDLRAQMQANPQFLGQQVRERVLKLALQEEAKGRAWDKREEVAYRADLARMDVIVGSWVAAQVQSDPSFPTDEQVQQAYDANKTKLVTPKLYHLAQIYLALPPGATRPQEEEAQRKLAGLRDQIVNQHADFAALAKKFSDDKASAPGGGDLGWVREDALIPPIKAAVGAALTDTALSPPIRGAEGWHLVKLMGTRPSAAATLAEARETLIKAMRQERMAQGQRAYLASILKQAPVEVNEIELGKLAGK